jgi:hypothetical protein
VLGRLPYDGLLQHVLLGERAGQVDDAVYVVSAFVSENVAGVPVLGLGSKAGFGDEPLSQRHTDLVNLSFCESSHG